MHTDWHVIHRHIDIDCGPSHTLAHYTHAHPHMDIDCGPCMHTHTLVYYTHTLAYYTQAHPHTDIACGPCMHTHTCILYTGTSSHRYCLWALHVHTRTCILYTGTQMLIVGPACSSTALTAVIIVIVGSNTAEKMDMTWSTTCTCCHDNQAM